mmetsp:Transcript_34579/g.75575  ORF Transcript_34579/g.75575 Transcript_34579/m.75575 type:complete len:358 (+) Transcript_34579:93-1166(+)
MDTFVGNPAIRLGPASSMWSRVPLLVAPVPARSSASARFSVCRNHWSLASILVSARWRSAATAAPTRAWPHSWMATVSRSRTGSMKEARLMPPVTRSIPSCRCSGPTASARSRAASSAASLSSPCSPAPVKPIVRRATTARSVPGSSRTPERRACTPSTSRRPAASGRPTVTERSKRPGRLSAASMDSGVLVAPSTITSLPRAAPPCSKPSISVRSWLSVWLSYLAPEVFLRPPSASISSMKITLGADSRAFLNSSRTRLEPTPTYISSKLEAAAAKKGTPAAPATARASSVLPVPGGPVSSTPFGNVPPRRVNLAGFLRYCTISSSSAFASSQPFTSANVFTLFSGRFSLLYSLGL